MSTHALDTGYIQSQAITATELETRIFGASQINYLYQLSW